MAQTMQKLNTMGEMQLKPNKFSYETLSKY